MHQVLFSGPPDSGCTGSGGLHGGADKGHPAAQPPGVAADGEEYVHATGAPGLRRVPAELREGGQRGHQGSQVRPAAWPPPIPSPCARSQLGPRHVGFSCHKKGSSPHSHRITSAEPSSVPGFMLMLETQRGKPHSGSSGGAGGTEREADARGPTGEM